MNNLKINDTSHGLLLLQVSNLKRSVEKHQLNEDLRQLYADYHEQRLQMENTLKQYHRKARRIRQLHAWQDEGQQGGPMTLDTHITSPV
jgi:hypothetical protein